MAKEKPDPGIAKRFTELAARTGLSDTQLGARIDVHPSQVGKIRAASRGLNFKSALLLCELVGADPWHLAFGRGNPTTDVDATVAQLKSDMARMQANFDSIEALLKSARSGATTSSKGARKR